MRPGRIVVVSLVGALALGGCSHRDRDRTTLREPDNASRLHIAETASAAGQSDIALSMYAAAAAAAPDDAEVQGRLVNALILAGKPNVAETTLNAALARQPNEPTLLRWLGNLRLQTGNAEAALQIFDGLIARRPTDVAALNGRGIALDLLGQHDAAQQTYLNARAQQPGNLQTANNLAVSLLLIEHPNQAASVLQPFSTRAGLPTRFVNNLAIARAAAGQSATGDGDGAMPAEDLRALAASFGASPGQQPSISPLEGRSGKPAG